MQNKDTMNTTLSTSNVTSNYSSIREEQGWDEFVAWCRDQENGPHE